MLPSFVCSSFTVLVGWPLAVVVLSFGRGDLWDGVHQLEGDCSVDLLYSKKRFSVKRLRVECCPFAYQVYRSLDIVDG